MVVEAANESIVRERRLGVVRSNSEGKGKEEEEEEWIELFKLLESY